MRTCSSRRKQSHTGNKLRERVRCRVGFGLSVVLLEVDLAERLTVGVGCVQVRIPKNPRLVPLHDPLPDEEAKPQGCLIWYVIVASVVSEKHHCLQPQLT